jgi:AAA family ATP:ADP antiporter
MKREAELAAIVASGGAVAQLVAGKAARDAMFLSTFDVRSLPIVVLVAALASLGSALLMSRAMALWTPARVVPVSLALSATLYAVEWTLLEPQPKLTAIMTYIHVAVFGTALIAGFWSVVNESFDPHSAKRSVRGIAMGGTAGGALGGLAGYTLGGSAGLHATLVLLCVLNLACVPAVIRVSRAATRPPVAADKKVGVGLGIFKEVPYLRQLALLVALAAVISALLDYVMSARVAGTLTDPKELVAFFALFHMGVGLSSFAVQALFTRPSLEKLGLAGTIALLPGSVLIAGAGAILLPGLGTAVALRGTESLFASSLYRAGYELLYTPLPRLQKRPAKVLIDVAVDRVGTVLGSGLVMLVLTYAAVVHAEKLMVALAMVAGAISLSIAVRLHRGYVASLASSLKRGVVRLRGTDIYDATTRRTLAETTAINRQVLLQAIEQQKGIQRPDSLFPPADPSEPPPESNDNDDERDSDMMLEARDLGFGAGPLSLRFSRKVPSSSSDSSDDALAALGDLSSPDTERIRSRLRNKSLLPAAAIPKAIELLGRDELSRDALGALRRVAPRITGQLVDALLDQERPVVQRRRIPRVLEVTPNQRTFDGLLEGMSDKAFEVRHQSAWALQRISEAEPSLAVPKEHVFRAVQDEINLTRENWNEGSTGRRNPDELKLEIMRTVEHGVVVLSLALEREPLQLAYRALLSNDEALRGTALEYFANVLPEDLRELALPFLEGLSPRKSSKRAAAELRDELLRTRGS